MNKIIQGFLKVPIDSLYNRVPIDSLTIPNSSAVHLGKKFLVAIFSVIIYCVFSAKHWYRRNRADLIESATPCHDAQLVGSYWVSNPFRLTVLASKSERIAPLHHNTFKFQTFKTSFVMKVLIRKTSVN